MVVSQPSHRFINMSRFEIFAFNLKQPLLLLFVAVIVVIQLVSSHPQCLDAAPPFKPRGRLSFCKHLPRLGCCTAQHSKELKVLYKQVIRQTPTSKTCRKYYIPTVLCLKCHSWAAHIFNSESNPNFQAALALPCLSPKFCAKFVRKCGDAVKFIWGDVMKVRNITIKEFCQESLVAADEGLCYPRIKKTLKQFSGDVGNTLNNSFAAQKGCLCVKEVARGLRSPLALVHANDQTNRMFVVEQIGVVYVLLKNGTKLSRPFLNITHKVYTTPWFGDERGLLGIAFHPKYRQNGRVFVYYTANTSANISKEYRRDWWNINPTGPSFLSEFRVSENDPNQLDPNSEKIILQIQQPAANHNGGQILFHDDEMLYIFTGDGGKAGDPFGRYGNALNKSTLLGKVLRIDINNENGKSYKIPPDNPFLNEPGSRPEIYAYGARNMWRCSVDRGSRSGYGKGRIFCGDVGQNRYEEIDIIKKGANYGWRGREGYRCYDKTLCNSALLANETLPIHAYSHRTGQSVVGGYVYRGCKYPKMRSLYFFADTMNGRIFTLKEKTKRSGKWESKEVCMGDATYCNGPKVSGSYAKNIYSFGEDEAGELYFVSTLFQRNNEEVGAVYQLIDPERRADPTTCKYKTREPARL